MKENMSYMRLCFRSSRSSKAKDKMFSAILFSGLSISLAVPALAEVTAGDYPVGPPQPSFPIHVGPQSQDTRMLEESDLKLPSAADLMPLKKGMPTIRLEAVYNQPVQLKDVVNFAVLHNLAIGISQEQMRSQKWLLIGALGKFLPNTTMTARNQFQAGSTLVGGVIPTKFSTPFLQLQAGMTQYLFQGGAVVFGALVSKHNFLASKAQLHASINDVLNTVSKQYYDLVRAQAFLEIRVRAVETSRAQLVLNQQLERAGTGTYFNVLQADTQLASDEQQLLTQEVAFRTAAINLANSLNLDLGANLMSVDSKVRKIRLIDPSLEINGLLRLAVKYRPELKQYEQLRLAARRQIQVYAAPLYPTVQIFGNEFGTGATLGPGYRVGGGGLSVGAGSSTNPSAMSIFPTRTGNAIVPVQGTFTQPSVQSRRIRNNYNLGFEIDWNYFNLGVPNMANVQSQRHIARQAMLQANQQFMNVMTQVRTSYLNSLVAEKQIDVTTRAVASSSEQLRLARVRLANGVGTNIDVLQAQQVWTQSLINRADAILTFNQAQVQLLHDTGAINIDALTSGRLTKE